jgi:hypothetical protein
MGSRFGLGILLVRDAIEVGVDGFDGGLQCVAHDPIIHIPL